jgi:hypothetical protein
MTLDYVASPNTTTLGSRWPIVGHELNDAEQTMGRHRYPRRRVVIDVSSETASPNILETGNIQEVTPPGGDTASALSRTYSSCFLSMPASFQLQRLDVSSWTTRALSEFLSSPVVDVGDDIAEVLAAGEDEYLEDGYSSVLEGKLSRLLATQGNVAVCELANHLRQERHSGEVAKVACMTLGLLGHPDTAEARLEALTSLLTSENPAVRDAAALGLALLDDKRAIPALRQAVSRERIASLQSDLQDILDQLSS